MLEKLEAYLSTHQSPKWVHLHRRIDGIEIEMEGRTYLAILYLIAFGGTCLFFDLTFAGVFSPQGSSRSNMPFLILFILGFNALLIGLCIYYWLRMTRKTVLRMGEHSDQFSLFHRSSAGTDDPPMSFDRFSFVAVSRWVHLGRNSYHRLEVYPDQEAYQKGISFWMKKPKGPCFTVDNWSGKRCDWVLELLTSLQKEPSVDEPHDGASALM